MFTKSEDDLFNRFRRLVGYECVLQEIIAPGQKRSGMSNGESHFEHFSAVFPELPCCLEAKSVY